MSGDIYGRGPGPGSKRSSVRRSVASRGRVMGGGSSKAKQIMKQRRAKQQKQQQKQQQSQIPMSMMEEAFDTGGGSGYEDLSSGYDTGYEEEGIMPGAGLDIDALAEQISEQVVEEGIFAGLDVFGDDSDLEDDTEDFGNIVPKGQPMMPSRISRRMVSSIARKRAMLADEQSDNEPSTKEKKLSRIDDEIQRILDEETGEMQRYMLLEATKRRDSIAYGSIHSTVPVYAPRSHDNELDRYGRLRPVASAPNKFDAWSSTTFVDGFLDEVIHQMNRTPVTRVDADRLKARANLAKQAMQTNERFLHSIGAADRKPLMPVVSTRYGSMAATVPVYAPRYHDADIERYGDDSKPPGTFTESLKMGAGLGLGVIAVVAGVGLAAKALS